MAKATVTRIDRNTSGPSAGYPERWGVTNDGEYMDGFEDKDE